MEKQTIGWMFMLSGKNGIVRVKVNFDDRFKDDKFYCDNEKITIVSDGVILNKSELFAKYKVTTLEDLLFLLLKKDFIVIKKLECLLFGDIRRVIVLLFIM